MLILDVDLLTSAVPQSGLLNLVRDIGWNPYTVLTRNGTLSQARPRRPDYGTADILKVDGSSYFGA